MRVIPLHHAHLGGAGKPPLVLLHGLLGSSRNWQTTGRDLAAAYEVWALDARNHGKSPHSADMTYSAMVADLEGWLDENRLGQVTLVGHSMGGKVAMLLACRHAERVARLVVVDIAPKDYQWIAHREEFAAMNELDLTNLATRQEAEERFAVRVPDLGMRKFLTTNLERNVDGGWRWSVNLPVLTAALPVLERNSLMQTDRFQGDVQFIVGGRSGYVRSADEATLRHHFPKAQVDRIPDAGHNPHMETRAEFVRLVQAASD